MIGCCAWATGARRVFYVFVAEIRSLAAINVSRASVDVNWTHFFCIEELDDTPLFLKAIMTQFAC